MTNNSLMANQYQLNSPPCVMETIEGEAIIINGDKGNYYNLQCQATLLLESLMNGFTPNDIVSFNKLSTDSVGHLTGVLIKALDEGIIVTRNEGPKTGEINQLTLNDPMNDIDIAVYSDMQDILALDPIHEADEIVGWPEKK